MTRVSFFRLLMWLIPLVYELAIEFLGIADPTYLTLTAIIRWAIPVWLRWMVLGWLVYHFGAAPINYVPRVLR